MKWSGTPVPCVVITLARRSDRHAAFTRRWARAGGGDIEVFHGHDERNGMLGCWRSHLDVLAAHQGPLAVFEDDALFAPTFTFELDPPAVEGRAADIVWLGGQHLAPPAALAPGWVRARRVARTHAYLARDPRALAAQLAHRGPRHVDMALTSLPITQVAADPFTVGQAPGISDINGRFHRQARFWNGASLPPARETRS